jgi:transposase
MAQAGQKATEGVTAAGRSLDEAAAKLASALTTHAQQIEKSDTASREQLKSLLSSHADSLQKATAASNEQLKLLLASHADSLQKATATLATQLDKITSLQKDIQQVLQIQQVTDGTMKQLAGGVEFSQTLSALRQHLTASDSLIKEVTKPRTIRLVESET